METQSGDIMKDKVLTEDVVTSENNRITGKTADLCVPLQETSIEIWDQKYRLKDIHGDIQEDSISNTYERVAAAVAAVEKTPESQKFWQKKFLWALNHGATPAGRIIANAGVNQYKAATSTVNTTVSDHLEDSMEQVLEKVQEAGLTLKSGAGIGYEFSTLRPSGSFVYGSGAQSAGPVASMGIFDKLCGNISSAGGKRGAQMATLDVSHPDVLGFIKAKREDGQLRHFNLSLLITDEFMNAVASDSQWPLIFPISQQEQQITPLDLNDDTQVLWKYWPVAGDYFYNEYGEVACRIYRTISAASLWNVIMTSTYDYAEPGFILIDRVNEMNNNWFSENIRATNSCGEQPLPPYGGCILGSVNLTRFVRQPFTNQASFDWSLFKDVVMIFTRMLDNVVDINGLPLPDQQQELIRTRRHGMGYLGLGSAITMLGMKYGDSESQGFTEEVTRQMAITGWQQGLELAREKGPAPMMDEMFTLTAIHFAQRPELKKDGYQIGDQLPGKVLHAKYSRYMQRIHEQEPELVNELAKVGSRFSHHMSIAPTGTISLSLGNNVSNGIEPSFAHHYARNIIKPGRKTKDKVDVFSYELLAYRKLVNPQAMPFSEDQPLPDYFITSDSVTPKQHVNIQAAAQKWVDSAISKTANVPTDFPFDEFKDIYRYAYEQGLKGCTTFRFNPEVFQGVLVKEQDLENTTYRFTLDNGEVVEAKGNDMIEYEGETHSAANLFDALKEGYYGKL